MNYIITKEYSHSVMKCRLRTEIIIQVCQHFSCSRIFILLLLLLYNSLLEIAAVHVTFTCSELL